MYLGRYTYYKYNAYSTSVVTEPNVKTTILFCTTAIAWPIIPGRWSIDIGLLKVRPWRVFMWTWAMPGLCGAVLLFLLPESPRYILAAKGAAFAVPIVAKMFAINHKKSPDEFPVR